jgi:hypothetical protein
VVEEYGDLAEVVEVGWRRGAPVSSLVVDLAITLVGGGCQCYTAILLAS